MKKEICPHCGKSMMQHRQTMSKSLASILVKCARQIGKREFNIQQDVELSKSQYTNFQKLKYWGFIERSSTNKHSWIISSSGFDFLLNKNRVYRVLWTYNNKVVELGGDTIVFSDLKIEPYGFKDSEQYAEEAVPYKQEKGQIKFL